jgi:hypothetical protein
MNITPSVASLRFSWVPVCVGIGADFDGIRSCGVRKEALSFREQGYKIIIKVGEGLGREILSFRRSHPEKQLPITCRTPIVLRLSVQALAAVPSRTHADNLAWHHPRPQSAPSGGAHERPDTPVCL